MNNLISNIKSYIRSKAIGLYISINTDDDIYADLVIVESKDRSITIVKKESFENLESLLEHLPSTLPLYLGINGKGVINKIISTSYVDNPLSGVLPNASPKDFFIQVTPADENSLLVSVARKENIGKIINHLNEVKVFPVQLQLGIFYIERIVSLLDNPSQLILPEYIIDIKEQKINSFSKTPTDPKEYIIDDQAIYNKYLLPFSLSLGNNLADQYIGVIDKTFRKQKQNFKYRKGLRTASLLLLVIIFLSLLVNFLLFDRLNIQDQELSLQLQNSSQTLNTIKEIEILILEKQEILDLYKEETPGLFSYYADRLAFSLTEGISLVKLTLAPLSESNNLLQKDQLVFIGNMIYITGRCYSGYQLNKWIKSLNGLSWINQITIQSYEEESGSKYAEFELRLKIQGDD